MASVNTYGVAKFGLDPEHPEVWNENKLAEQIGNLTLCLASRRLATQLVHTHGLPGRLASLLDAGEAPATLLWLTELHAAWLLVKERPERYWKKIIERSPFKLVVVDKAFWLLVKPTQLNKFKVVAQQLRTQIKVAAQLNKFKVVAQRNNFKVVA